VVGAAGKEQHGALAGDTRRRDPLGRHAVGVHRVDRGARRRRRSGRRHERAALVERQAAEVEVIQQFVHGLELLARHHSAPLPVRGPAGLRRHQPRWNCSPARRPGATG